MKIHFALLTSMALLLGACGGDKSAEQNAAPANQAQASSSQVATASASDAVAASNSATVSADCRITIDSNDTMQFSTKEINVKSSCKDFTLTLQHSGSQAKLSMGHNIVITKASDRDGVAADGMVAGADKDYVKPEDARVIAATKLIGGGENDTITFPVNKLVKGEEYVFFCSFPGHLAMMSGKVNLVD